MRISDWSSDVCSSDLILAIYIVFSLDSVITAVGMTDNLPIMVTAVCIAIAVMMFAATPISNFIRRHPTTNLLALAFLLLIGVALVAHALHFPVPRGYLYFAIAFSLLVATLNLVATRRRKSPAAPAGPASLSFRSPLPAPPLSPRVFSPR